MLTWTTRFGCSLRAGSIREAIGQQSGRLLSSAAAVATPVEGSTLQKAGEEKKTKPRGRPNLSKLEKGPHGIHKAVDIVLASAWAKLPESVDISVNTGLDPRKPNQNIKGVAKLPFGRGKKIRVCVLAQGEDAEKAKAAGADVVGAETVIKSIQDGDVNFQTVIATPDMMAAVAKIGRILGPRGLMPNPKVGTMTKDVVKAVKEAKAGAVQFKTEKHGVVHASLGKVAFTRDALLDNIRSFMVALVDAKPEGFKGRYLLSASLSSTMGPGIGIELSSIDPTSPRFMMEFTAAAAPTAKKSK